MKQLKTNIDKAHVTSLCADAISELERAVRLFPEWPAELSPAGFQQTRVIDYRLQTARQCNQYKYTCTAHSIFEEEYYEFLQAAIKPGNLVAARIELVQAMAMLLRISCHLNDYVQHGATESTEKTIKADPSNPLNEKARAASVEHRMVSPQLMNSFLGPTLRGVWVTDDQGRKVLMQP
jgi:hypothetical protein